MLKIYGVEDTTILQRHEKETPGVTMCGDSTSMDSSDWEITNNTITSKKMSGWQEKILLMLQQEQTSQ